jgi:hypothetical protein
VNGGPKGHVDQVTPCRMGTWKELSLNPQPHKLNETRKEGAMRRLSWSLGIVAMLLLSLSIPQAEGQPLAQEGACSSSFGGR